MKKRNFLLIMLIVCNLLALSGCRKEEVLYLGLNAEVLEVDVENQKICVKDLDEPAIFGAECYIECKDVIEEHQILYCNYETSDLKEIELKDLQVGDELILTINETELTRIKADATGKVSQIQLGTQRLN